MLESNMQEDNSSDTPNVRAVHGLPRSKYKWVKPRVYSQEFLDRKFKPGQSGNPSGKAKGKGLKEFVREYLEKLTDEDKIEFLKHIPMDMVWRMAEGNPESKSDVTSNGKTIVHISEVVAKKNEINDTSDTEAK